MTDAALTPHPVRRRGLARLLADPRFQSWAARMPLLRRAVRRDGEAMFDLLAGFCHSQILTALVELDVLETLLDGPVPSDEIARRARMPEPRARVLLRSGVAVGLLKEKRAGYALTRKGAALTGVPGLAGMISHNRVLYRDLADPAAFFRGESETEMSAFWPYVFGAGAATDPASAARYSRLMSDTQGLVAEETLRAVSLRGVRHLMDVGGGTGTFLARAAAARPEMALTLFDLPAVVAGAPARLGTLAGRVRIVPGSFRDDPLPVGADAISFVRVLYDHSDETVRALLSAAHAALPPGGRLIVSEPMTGGATPERAGDAYFSLYTLAMGTGRARSAAEIVALCEAAGFGSARVHRSRRPFVTGVVSCRKSVRPD